MPDLLLELFSEEIPARMQAKAADDLRRMVTDKLVAEGLVYEGAKAFATPRRLALTVHGIPVRQPDLKDERKGPKVGAPDAAVQGFLKAAGLKSLDEAKIQRDSKKGDFYVALIEKPGRPAIDVIAEILPVVVRTFPWPKQMRWGELSAKPGALTWVRPLHSIIATFGPETEEPDIVKFDVAGIAAGQTTRGHRFMAPGEFSVRRFEDYEAKLHDAKVVLDPQRRKDIILADAKELAFAQGFELIEDQVLLDEVSGLVEWPVVLMGSFDQEFLSIPGEVIRATIRNNQKCFVVNDPTTGKLAPKFILTANIEASDGGKAIVAGNERVIRARLSDAKFFYETDLKTKLEDRLPKFANIVFHEKLGTQSDLIKCIERLAAEIAPIVNADIAKVKRAARLARADLLTEIVGEFPEVQGVMGRHYAEFQGEDAVVAVAIEDHYKPLGPSDRVPTDPVSVGLALADKIEVLVGFWAIDDKPTSSKDPFALRRAVLGAIRLILANNIRIGLKALFRKAITLAIYFCFRPEFGYPYLGHSWNPQTETGPSESWNRPQHLFLLNSDGFIDRDGEKIAMEQIGNPDLGGEDDEEEYNERSIAFEEFRRRLEHLEKIAVPFMFDDIPGEVFTGSAVAAALKNLEGEEFVRLAMDNLSSSLLAFFADRLKVQLRDQGARHDLVDAVFALQDQDDLLLIVHRVEALGRFLETEDGRNLLAGYKRAANILKIEEKKDGVKYVGEPDSKLFTEKMEEVLWNTIQSTKVDASHHIALAIERIGQKEFEKQRHFDDAMDVLSTLRPHVDAFFDKVKVNDDDPTIRENRLKLLNEIRAATRTVADFSRIQD